MKVEVLGSGCANCRNTAALIAEVAAQAGVSIDLAKVEDMQAIVGYGVLTTPAVVVDGKVVHAGGIPRREAVVEWLKSGATVATPAAAGGCCCGHQGKSCCS